MAEYSKVMRASALREGQLAVGRVGIRQVALVRRNGEVFAFRNVCPHAGQSFATARPVGYRVTCPRHQWEFDIRDGACAAHDLYRLRVYPAREEGDWILVAPTEDDEIW